jgi:DnaD/phage-associated family protein
MKKSEKQKININYGEAISVLPSKVLEHVDKAKKFDIKLLILLSSSEKYREGKYINALADELNASEAEVESSISFWRGTGVLTLDDTSEIKKADKTTKKEETADVPKRAKVTELPQYTTKELNSLLEKNKFVVDLIDECQNILGKIFTASEIRVIMGLVEYLGLDHDYILVLMHYCARVDMKSMRYIEKLALSCLDEGYTEAAVLQKALYAKEEKHKIEGEIKSIFGLGTRKLTSKEEKQINTWINDFKYDIEIIEKAYDLTVGATNKPSIHYANAILEKWNAEGIKTIDDVNALLDEREQKKAEDGASSFNVDEFFDAALKRSYSDK